MTAMFIERLLHSRAGILPPTRTLVALASPPNRARFGTSSILRDRAESEGVVDSQDQDETRSASSSSESPSRLGDYLSTSTPRNESPASYSDSPRVYRGVHKRDYRSKGQTPAEREAINQSITQILKDLNEEGFNNVGSLQLDNFRLPNPDRLQDENLRDSTGLRPWSQTVRRGVDREEDDSFAEELDEMKEEVSALTTDLELLDWARRRIFVSTPTSESSVDTSLVPGSESVEALTFPKTYPQIIGHAMRVARQSFNNPHLALSFFHHAQTSSPESYLTGCLASAYNELIKTRWECFRDLDGVDQALREMDANAVSWNIKTQRVVGKIVEEVGREVIEQGADVWGEGVFGILDRLEKKVQRAIRQTEYMDEQAKRRRERRLWSGVDDRDSGSFRPRASQY